MGLVSAFAILLTSLTLTLVLPILTHRTKLHLASLRRACASPPLRPSSDPLFGLDILFTNINYLKTNQRVKQWHNSFRQYGATYGFYLFGKRTIATIDARNVQFVLATEFEKFGVGPGRLKGSLPMVGRGVINTDGEVWRRGRDLIMPVFSRSQIADREMFERHFAKFLERLQGCGDETVDLKPMFDELILDASSEFVFGESLDTLSMSGGSVDAKAFMDAFTYSQKIVGMRVMLGKLSFLIRDKKFWDSCKLVQTFTQRQIDRAVHRAIKQEESKPKYNLVKEIAKENNDEESLRSQLLNVFFGGRDTPAVALSNIREEVGRFEPKDLSFEKLKSMRYLQHVINEGLRLYPALPTISRACLVETAIPYGGGPDGNQPICVIPGDTITCGFFTMHRDPDVFGSDVESFRPERWQDIRPGWNYLPFGGGTRHCPAQQLALFWVSYTIARVAIEFKELWNRDPEDEYKESLRLNMESLNGVKVGLVRTHRLPKTNTREE